MPRGAIIPLRQWFFVLSRGDGVFLSIVAADADGLHDPHTGGAWATSPGAVLSTSICWNKATATPLSSPQRDMIASLSSRPMLSQEEPKSFRRFNRIQLRDRLLHVEGHFGLLEVYGTCWTGNGVNPSIQAAMTLAASLRCHASRLLSYVPFK